MRLPGPIPSMFKTVAITRELWIPPMVHQNDNKFMGRLSVYIPPPWSKEEGVKEAPKIYPDVETR